MAYLVLFFYQFATDSKFYKFQLFLPKSMCFNLHFGNYLCQTTRYLPKSHFFLAYFGNNLYLCNVFFVRIVNDQIFMPVVAEKF